MYLVLLGFILILDRVCLVFLTVIRARMELHVINVCQHIISNPTVSVILVLLYVQIASKMQLTYFRNVQLVYLVYINWIIIFLKLADNYVEIQLQLYFHVITL